MSVSDIPFVSVIIPAYNDSDRLALCLEALESQTYPAEAYEVLVVDNGSQPPVTLLPEAYPHARLLVEPQAGSYTARNTGLDAAQGEVIGFTDADCIPMPDWIAQGVKSLAANPGCGLVGGQIVLFAQDEAHPTASELYEMVTSFRVETFVTRYHFSPTANVFTRRDVFERVGRFNSNLKSGGDFEWGYRVYQAGLPLVYADDVCVRHPARHDYDALRRKALRVVAGDFACHRRDTNGWRLADIPYAFEDLVPPPRSIMRILRAGHGPARTAGMLSVLARLRWLRTREKLRLLLGGVSTAR